MATRFSSGLVVTPNLTASMVVSVDLQFEPSVGIMARKFDKLGLDIRSFREPLKRAVRDVMIPSIQMNFKKAGRPRWAELSEATIQQKPAGTTTLIRSGALMRGMSRQNIWHIDREKALIAGLPDAIWYGRLHQAGYGEAQMFQDPVTGQHVNIGGSGAPARPFVMIQEEDAIAIDRIFNEWLGERIIRAGLR